MIRKELFEAIKKQLAERVPQVQHIDLWNHNVEFIEQEAAWERPAVFVQFDPIAWSPFQGEGQRGTGTFHLHIVTDWDNGRHDAAFELSQAIYEAIDNLQGEHFGGIAVVETSTNHNHEELLESIDTYGVRYTR